MTRPFFQMLREVVPVHIPPADTVHVRLNAIDPGWDVETAKAWQPSTATLSLEEPIGKNRFRVAVLTFAHERDAGMFIDAMNKVLAEKAVE